MVIMLAAAGSVLAVAHLESHKPLSVSSCGDEIVAVPGYAVVTSTRPSPPRASGTEVLVKVDKSGRPLTGASVCLALDMVGMPMGGPSRYTAQPVAPGLYDAYVPFGMGGRWAGRLVVSVGGEVVYAKAITFDVTL